MKKIPLLISLTLAAASAQMTPDQKLADFRELAAVYNKYYAPYEWKKALFGFDLLNIAPWVDRVAKSKTDLDFYEICSEYVSGLQDTHVNFTVPSSFSASLGFTVDIYDSKVLVDGITRSRLPVARYPFEIGDEVVSVDGQDVENLIAQFSKYLMQSNPRSTRRQAASRIVTRAQSRIPKAVEVGDSASVVIRRATGTLETYTIPWVKSGIPVEVGPVPMPHSKGSSHGVRAAAEDDPVPDYMQPLLELQNSSVSDTDGVLNYGTRNPLFALPSDFVLRQGKASADFFYSGTFQSGGFHIGYIRIPNYGPPNTTTALQAFETEIAYFEENTDGLIVDEMRNTGGNLCFGENIVARLVPYTFQVTAFQMRAFWGRVQSFYNSLSSARAQGADQWIIDTYQGIFDGLYQAYTENRGLTGPLPLCSYSLQKLPAGVVYTKPVMMIIDEFSTSTADSVPAMFQSAGRGPLFGMRSNGAGGNNTSFSSGVYSESTAGVTIAMQVRRSPITTADYPTTDIIESVGVRPDIEVDYMTRENLLQNGRPFVNAFTAAMVDLIRKE